MRPAFTTGKSVNPELLLVRAGGRPGIDRDTRTLLQGFDVVSLDSSTIQQNHVKDTDSRVRKFFRVAFLHGIGSHRWSWWNFTT